MQGKYSYICGLIRTDKIFCSFEKADMYEKVLFFIVTIRLFMKVSFLEWAQKAQYYMYSQLCQGSVVTVDSCN